jgi:hypothetical protein
MTTALYAFQLRGGTAAEWASANPVLAEREPGVETDTARIKVGDGATQWTDLHYIRAPATTARAFGNAQQSLVADWNKIALDTVDYDTSGIVDIANDRLVVPRAGYYQVNGQIDVNAPANADLIIAAYVNGVERSRGARHLSSSTASFDDFTVSDVLDLDAGDYVELWVSTSKAAVTGSLGASTNYLSILMAGA